MSRIPVSNFYTVPREDFGRRAPARRDIPAKGISRGLFLTAAIAAGVFAMWSGLVTSYVVFRDDALQALFSQQRNVVRAYDTQIATLEAELHRIRSMRFVDQERVDRQMAELRALQRAIENRQTAINTLAQSVGRGQPEITGSVPPAKNRPADAAPPPAPAPDAKPRPISDVIRVDPAPAAPLQSRITPALRPTGVNPALHEIADIAARLARVSNEQADALNRLEQQADERLARAQQAIALLPGPAALPAPPRTATAAAPVGGPFVPANAAPRDPFARQLFRINQAAAETERLTRHLSLLPVLSPISGPAEITSGFGSRVDPFLRQMALHSGIDFRAETGEPIRTTAAGTVIWAGWNGGYGQMVEIDHGNGFTTRYAHLSAVLVKDGAVLPAGAMVGRAGSTGRSTGPHLHYEVRFNGDAVDPLRFLRAGQQLALRR
jgi:murein DD-endopeptidase MepM/ murein hydrolase activator NlpD